MASNANWNIFTWFALIWFPLHSLIMATQSSGGVQSKHCACHNVMSRPVGNAEILPCWFVLSNTKVESVCIFEQSPPFMPVYGIIVFTETFLFLWKMQYFYNCNVIPAFDISGAAQDSGPYGIRIYCIEILFLPFAFQRCKKRQIW